MRYQWNESRETSAIAFTWLTGALVGAGVALRVWQYLGRSALWTDEATLANNIVGRSLGPLLLEPLAHSQAAPFGFLLIEKLAVRSFGANELALRAFPLVCSIIALFLLWRVALRVLPRAIVPMVIAPFALAPPLIFFAADAKQYSSDIAVALLMLLIALEMESRELGARRAVAIAAAGAVAVWLSQPAVLVVVGLAAALIASALIGGERRKLGALAGITGVWALSALAAIRVSLERLSPDVHRLMYDFWNGGFWPMTLAHGEGVVWPFMRTASLLNNQLAVPGSAGTFGAILVIVGGVTLWKRDRPTALLLIAPTFVALGASAARLYPFADRLAVFLIPSLLLLVGAGVEGITIVLNSRRFSMAVIASATLAVLALDARALRAAPPVYRREEIAPAIEYLRHNARDDDETYIYYGGAPAFEFYASQRAIPGARTIGGCFRGDLREYLSELDRYRGRARTWVLFAHELPRLHERETMLRYLDTIGSVRDSVGVPGRDVNGSATSVHLYLYDLSDTSKLRAASAQSFALPVQPPLEARFGCMPAGE